MSDDREKFLWRHKSLLLKAAARADKRVFGGGKALDELVEWGYVQAPGGGSLVFSLTERGVAWVVDLVK